MPCGDFPAKGKIVLVTGGGSGINLAFVKLILQHQVRGIIIGDLQLTAEAEEIVQRNAGAVTFVRCDVTKRKDLEKLVTASLETFGDVPDVYVAGAGVFEPAWSNWWDDTEEDGYATLDINTTHALKLSRIATKALVARGKRGVILIVASLAGYMGTFACPLYCTSKHAVVGFTRSMEPLDQLENIKIVLAAPGMVKTPLWTDRPEKMAQFGYDESATSTPEWVAENMLNLIVQGQYAGGTCLEISQANSRCLGTWNIEAPQGQDTKVPQELIDKNWAPLKNTLENDRRSKL